MRARSLLEHKAAAWTAVAFAVPYLIAFPFFVSEERLFGLSPETSELFQRESTTMEMSMAIGFVCVLCVRRTWRSRLITAAIYLVITALVFTIWGAWTRGHLARIV
jgi:hypothetical protein